MTAADTRAALRDATLARDHAAIVALLGDRPTLRSPVVRFPFEGREAVADVYRAVIDAFEGFELLTELGEEQGPQMLRFRARVLGREVQTVAVVETGADARIDEVTIFVRPLAGVAAVGAAMGPGLARQKGRLHVLAAWLLTRWLPPVIESADPILPRLLRFRSR